MRGRARERARRMERHRDLCLISSSLSLLLFSFFLKRRTRVDRNAEFCQPCRPGASADARSNQSSGHRDCSREWCRRWLIFPIYGHVAPARLLVRLSQQRKLTNILPNKCRPEFAEYGHRGVSLQHLSAQVRVGRRCPGQICHMLLICCRPSPPPPNVSFGHDLVLCRLVSAMSWASPGYRASKPPQNIRRVTPLVFCLPRRVQPGITWHTGMCRAILAKRPASSGAPSRPRCGLRRAITR